MPYRCRTDKDFADLLQKNCTNVATHQIDAYVDHKNSKTIKWKVLFYFVLFLFVLLVTSNILVMCFDHETSNSILSIFGWKGWRSADACDSDSKALSDQLDATKSQLNAAEQAAKSRMIAAENQFEAKYTYELRKLGDTHAGKVRELNIQHVQALEHQKQQLTDQFTQSGALADANGLNQGQQRGAVVEEPQFRYFATDNEHLKEFCNELNLFLTDIRQVPCVAQHSVQNPKSFLHKIFRNAFYSDDLYYANPSDLMASKWDGELPWVQHHKHFLTRHFQFVNLLAKFPMEVCAELQKAMKMMEPSEEMMGWVNKLVDEGHDHHFSSIGAFRSAPGSVSSFTPLTQLNSASMNSAPSAAMHSTYTQEKAEKHLLKLCTAFRPRIKRLLVQYAKVVQYTINNNLNPYKMAFDLIFGCSNSLSNMQNKELKDINFDYILQYIKEQSEKMSEPYPDQFTQMKSHLRNQRKN